MGAEVQADSGKGTLAAAALGIIFIGILGSYYLVIWAAGVVAARRLHPGEGPAPRRHNWNRSMRDERKKAPQLTPLETVFVVTTIAVGLAYFVWFFLFAGSSLPST